MIQRKISFGTTSDAGDKSLSRIHTLIETCKSGMVSQDTSVNAYVKCEATKDEMHNKEQRHIRPIYKSRLYPKAGLYQQHSIILKQQ